jgi:N6-adenosine-specific RNA methylase IME4
MDRAADNHYRTAPIDDILSVSVPSIAADDCVLFLWATMPMLPQAFDVMQTWGFTYRSGAIWAKDRLGTGFWFRNKHELLLVGVKGDIPGPVEGTQSLSVIEAPVAAHSEKPKAFYNLIESYFPLLPKIELFARQARDGWDRFGDQSPQ